MLEEYWPLQEGDKENGRKRKRDERKRRSGRAEKKGKCAAGLSQGAKKTARRGRFDNTVEYSPKCHIG